MQVFTTKEISSLLKMNPHKIGWLRKYGLLKGIKAGKGYIFSEEEIKRFLEEFQGSDLSSEHAIQLTAEMHKKAPESLGSGRRIGGRY